MSATRSADSRLTVRLAAMGQFFTQPMLQPPFSFCFVACWFDVVRVIIVVCGWTVALVLAATMLHWRYSSTVWFVRWWGGWLYVSIFTLRWSFAAISLVVLGLQSSTKPQPMYNITTVKCGLVLTAGCAIQLWLWMNVVKRPIPS